MPLAFVCDPDGTDRVHNVSQFQALPRGILNLQWSQTQVLFIEPMLACSPALVVHSDAEAAHISQSGFRLKSGLGHYDLWFRIPIE